MTRPIAANTDPALRARLTAILAPLPVDVAEVIARVGETEARAGGNTGTAWTQCAAALGRSVTQPEIVALEACIRAHLEAGTVVQAEPYAPRSPHAPPVPVHPSPAEMARDTIGAGEHAYAFGLGVKAERNRLRALLDEMAEARREEAAALNDPAPRGLSEAIEAAELQGAARVLRELAEGLR